jgi:hypothetical protein
MIGFRCAQLHMPSARRGARCQRRLVSGARSRQQNTLQHMLRRRAVNRPANSHCVSVCMQNLILACDCTCFNFSSS